MKKCYFADYRFSEDMDFTSSLHMEKRKFLSNLKKVIQAVQTNTGILFGKIRCTDKLFKGSLAAYKCIIPFWGACHPKNKPVPPEKRWTSSIKPDVTFHEILCMKNQKREIIHPYSDELSNRFATCYAMEEIISEKFRALLQRNYTAPRDYYDLWYIIKHVHPISWGDVADIFKRKCSHKTIRLESYKEFFEAGKIVSCKKEWANSLGHHLSAIPTFDDVIRELQDFVMKMDYECGFGEKNGSSFG